QTTAKGTAILEPLNVQIAASTRDAPLDPYRPYFPFPARLSGLLSGDSLSEVQRGPKGELILASRGTASGRDLAVRAPGLDEPVVRVDAVQIRGIDFSWPNYALVERVFMQHPQIRVERAADGSMNLRTLFKAVDGDKAPATDSTAAPPAAPASTAAVPAPAATPPGEKPASGGPSEPSQASP